MTTVLGNQQLGPIVRTVTLDTIADYEEILGIGNPLHFDEEYARATPFGGIIAHGMMSLAYVSEMMARTFGRGWYEAGELDTTFVRAVRPGDTITTRGKITGQRSTSEETFVVCEIYCENQLGERVLEGTAQARAAGPVEGIPEIGA
jgi:3-hydroxybutyryl-CoA dehydratase